MFSKIRLPFSISTNHFCYSRVPLQLALILTCCATFSNLLIESANGQAKPTPSAASDEEDEFAPEKVTLETKDKVNLVCTYFPAGVQAKPAAKKGEAAADTETEPAPVDGKRTIPYIILHDWERSRADTEALAKFLSAQGNAVITPDLRGHGESTQVVGSEESVDAKDFKPNQIAATLEDIEACKRFLVKKNNAGDLNVDMLTVIAIGKTVPMATAWVVKDWSFAPYSKGIKQGQDVKFLIMIAPEKKLGPFSMNRVTSAPIFAGHAALPTIVSWATASSSAKNSEAIFTRLKKKRPEPTDKSAEAKTLYQAPLKGSSRSGVQIGSDAKLTKLWKYFDNTVSGKINQNLDKLPWQDRSKEP